VNPQALDFIRKAEGSSWTATEREHALEQALHAPVPSRLEEDWRKTDPEEFPWARLTEVDAATTRTDVAIRSLGASQSTGLVPLEADGSGTGRDLQLISGDDYDAKFLYFHKAFSRTSVAFRALKGSHGDPVEVIQLAAGPGLATFTTVLVVESGAELVFYDRWEVGKESPAGIGRTEIVVEDGGKLVYIQEENADEHAALYRRARVQLGREAQLEWYAATPGAQWHVARLEMQLNGPGADGVFKGIYTGSGSSRADHRTHQFHGAPNGTSNLTMKTLLSGTAHSIYQGIITVPQHAQKTDAYQQCRNLLLEAGTHADAIPKLEIIADDVRCTHGASMGSVNPDQVFYLQSRGLTRHQAMVAIASGFAEEIIRFVPLESVQVRWRDLVAQTIGKVQIN
jgi:Fe-S cluster assembly protein SufD